MLIEKKGKIIRFSCGSCGCVFVAGINSIENNNGNFYCNCPCCGDRCHTDYGKMGIDSVEESGKS